MASTSPSSPATSTAASRFAFGTVVWAKPIGWTWWPALVVPYEVLHFMDVRGAAPSEAGDQVVVEFFGCGRISVLPPAGVVRFEAGMRHLRAVRGRYEPEVKFAARAAQEWISLCG